jgi:hypothetical protein
MRLILLGLLASTLALALEDKNKKPALVPQEGGGWLKAGSNLPGPFHPFNVTGKHKGQFHCLVSEHGYDPGVLILVRDNDVGDALRDEYGEALKSLLRKLDAEMGKKPGARLGVFAVFLPEKLKNVVEMDDERDAQEIKLQALAKEEPPLKHVVLALDSKADLANYNLDSEAAVTVILYRKLRVVAAYSDKLNADMVKRIIEEVTKMLATPSK